MKKLLFCMSIILLFYIATAADQIVTGNEWTNIDQVKEIKFSGSDGVSYFTPSDNNYWITSRYSCKYILFELTLDEASKKQMLGLILYAKAAGKNIKFHIVKYQIATNGSSDWSYMYCDTISVDP